MPSRPTRTGALALVAALSLAPLAACDNEDMRDVEEGVEGVEEGAKDVGKGVEDAVDKIDNDGKDD
jgi:hypothetical protein